MVSFATLDSELEPLRSSEQLIRTAGVRQTLSGRWGSSNEVFADGFLAVPTLFLKLYANLNPPLTPAEAVFVLELMTFKWDTKHPYPSYETLAERMNVTDKMVRRYAQKLEDKHYVRRVYRKNQPNEFDLTGLFNALRSASIEREYGKKRTNIRAGKQR
jgi:Helix-turn-helix domain